MTMLRVGYSIVSDHTIRGAEMDGVRVVRRCGDELKSIGEAGVCVKGRRLKVAVTLESLEWDPIANRAPSYYLELSPPHVATKQLAVIEWLPPRSKGNLRPRSP